MDLGEIRKEIDRIDRELSENFQKRMELCRQVGEYKLKNGMKVLDPARERASPDSARKPKSAPKSSSRESRTILGRLFNAFNALI